MLQRKPPQKQHRKQAIRGKAFSVNALGSLNLFGASLTSLSSNDKLRLDWIHLMLFICFDPSFPLFQDIPNKPFVDSENCRPLAKAKSRKQLKKANGNVLSISQHVRVQLRVDYTSKQSLLCVDVLISCSLMATFSFKVVTAVKQKLQATRATVSTRLL